MEKQSPNKKKQITKTTRIKTKREKVFKSLLGILTKEEPLTTQEDLEQDIEDEIPEPITTQEEQEDEITQEDLEQDIEDEIDIYI